MPLPKEALDRIAEDIEKAEASIAELKDVVSDMRLSGMDVTTQTAAMKDLSDKIRQLKVFYERQKAKSTT